MIRDVRLWLATWRGLFAEAGDRLAALYRRATCPHHFRPALVRGGPGRVCPICDKAESLTREEFFAHFGERYQGMINGRD